MASRAACRRQYFNNQLSTLPLLDVIKADIDPATNTITIFFPYPFQILGLGAITDWTTNPPSSELPMPEFWEVRSTAINEAEKEWIQQLFTLMMYANRDVDNYGQSPFFNAIEYQEYLFGQFNNYFNNFLNANLKPVFYNQFLQNPSMIRKFWTDELAAATPNTVITKLQEFVLRMFEGSDRRLWGAPGKYLIYYGGTSIEFNQLLDTVFESVAS